MQPRPRRPFRPLFAALTVAALTLTLASCGGGSDAPAPAPAPTPAPPPANSAPVAAFSSPASVAAGTPISFDATASRDADGDALTYSWDFGAGRRGGGSRIARVFDQAGTVTARLTVTDARGASTSIERTVTVTAGPAAVGSVSTLAVVRDLSGAPLDGVTVTAVQGNVTATTGADGRASIVTERGVPVTLRFSRSGYADQFQPADLPPGAESGYLEVVMQPREPALTLTSAAAGGTLTGKDGARVTFAPNSLVDGNGSPVSGPVQVAITPVDIAANPRAFPGRFAGLRPDGAQGLLWSYGTVEFALSAGGSPVQLAPGRVATIEIPIYARLNRDGSPLTLGSTSPLWSLDERTGGWIEEGSGTVVAAATPSDFALRAEVSHFSWWNHDAFEAPPALPQPRCRIDTNLDGVAEDLTDTGYCWHLASPSNPLPSSVSPAPAGVVRPLAEPRTVRLPTTTAQASTPVSGGVDLPIPADVDILFRSYAKSGTLMGSRIVRLGAGVRQAVDIVLYPVKTSDATLAIALPYDDSFAQSVPGDTDRFTFAVEAGAQYEVTVTRGRASLLDGTAGIANGSTSLASGSFGASGFSTTVAATANGTFTVSVAAGLNAPGSYRLQVRRVINTGCANPVPLALPSTTASVPVAAASIACFSVALAADDVIEIASTQGGGASGTVRLFAPSGDEIEVDTYGGADAMLLRAAVVTAGTYRIEIANTLATNGSVNGFTLARITPTAVLNPGDSASFNVPAGSRPNEFYVLKAAAGADRAVVVEAGVGDQQMQIWPGGGAPQTATSSSWIARVRTAPSHSHLLVRVHRFASDTAGHSYRVINRAPDALALDADQAITLSASERPVRVFRVDGQVAQRISVGLLTDNAASAQLQWFLFGPAGSPVLSTGLGNLYQFTEPGLHTLVLSRDGSGLGSATARVNSVSIEPISLASPVDRTVQLALGQVLHYRPTVAQGQLVGISLQSPTQLDVGTLVSRGASDGALGALTLPSDHNSRPAPRSIVVGPAYATQAGPVNLFVYSPSRSSGRATGALSLNITSPTPVPTNPGAAFSVTTDPRSYLALGYTLPAVGYHLVCLSYPTEATPNNADTLRAALWRNLAQGSGTQGLLWLQSMAVGSTRHETLVTTRAEGAHTLTLAAAGSHAVSGRLIALAAPAASTANAAAGSATLDTPCDRRYHSFAGVAGQTYSVRVTAGFAGTLYVRKQEASGDWSARSGGTFVGSLDLAGSPAALVANQERVLSFTIPATSPFGSGTYIVEVDADLDATGSYTLQLTSP